LKKWIITFASDNFRYAENDLYDTVDTNLGIRNRLEEFL